MYDSLRKTCAKCGTANPLIPVVTEGIRQRQPAATPKQRARNASKIKSTRQGPASRAAKGAAAVFPDQIAGRFEMEKGKRLLRTSQGLWPVHILSDVPASCFVGAELVWRRVAVEGRVIQIEPMPSVLLSKLRAHATEAHRLFLLDKIGVRVPSSTRIAKAKGAGAQLRALDAAAHSPNPPAWAEVCSCWQIGALQPAVESAMQHIGWNKISYIVNTTAGWPDDLRALVERKLKEANKDHVNRPWDPGDYLLQDW